MYLVSACLVGENCKYSGENNFSKTITEFLKDKEYIKICPEYMGGMKIPRSPAEIEQGCGQAVLCGIKKVYSREHKDVTEYYLKGAYKVLEIAEKFKPELCILKSKSPSCGINKVYNGKFDGTLVDGSGVTAQLLLDNGYKVINENDFKNK